MSLINQVLQNLDQRNVNVAAEVPVGLAPEIAKHKPYKRLAVWVLGSVGMAAVLWFFGEQYQQDIVTFFESQNQLEQQTVVVVQQPQSPRFEDKGQVIEAAGVADVVKDEEVPLPAVVEEVRADTVEQQTASIQNLPHPTEAPEVTKIEADIEPEWLPKQPPQATPLQAKPEKVLKPRAVIPKAQTMIEIAAVKVPKLDDFKQAQRLIDKGRFVEAEPLLMSFVQVNPLRLDAVELLIGVYMRDGRLLEAQYLIEQALLADANNATLLLLKAKILVEKGDSAAAVELLLPQVVEPQPAPEVMRLLGALLQQSGRLTEAVIVYDLLAKSQPNDGSVWLGLAIALDGLNQEGALEAYQRSIGLGGITQVAAAYARDRLVVLSGR